MSPTRTKNPAADSACVEAVELAKAAVTEAVPPEQVGEHLGVHAEEERVVTHFFDCLDPGYRGWRWAATVTRALRSKKVTVDETALLPGPDALLSPEWLPWSERLRPGDLGVGDLLPTPENDERLVPGYTQTGPVEGEETEAVADETDRFLIWEPGLGRARVLSPIGRDRAAKRWYSSSGPDTPLANAAPAQCSTCGFFIPLAGALKQVFGVCANELAPDDGNVVSVDHGCGAHSEAVEAPAPYEPPPPIIDELGYEPIEHPPGSVDDTSSEPFGHS
ncbi:MAG: DUF3027 domain-containing protein [Streptosporangiales bacterium]|nr:DUF3027 domain-containing protein [Streptosporangiales bacterium]